MPKRAVNPWKRRAATMPLLDHFRPPLVLRRHWHAFHNAWATYIASDLNRLLPDGYFAEPNVQFGIEIDVATFEERNSSPDVVWSGGTGPNGLDRPGSRADDPPSVNHGRRGSLGVRPRRRPDPRRGDRAARAPRTKTGPPIGTPSSPSARPISSKAWGWSLLTWSPPTFHWHDELLKRLGWTVR